MNIPNIVSFSGGQTSGYMLRRLMDSESNFDKRFTVVFCNTGREHDATLDFVHDVQTHWGVPIVWLEYWRVPVQDIDPLLVPEGIKRTNLRKAATERDGKFHWWREVSYVTASRRGDARVPFDELLDWMSVLPNAVGRACSAYLKRRTLQRWLEARQTGRYNCQIGIRKDEEHRATEIKAKLDDRNEVPQFPLCEWGVTLPMVNAWWDSHAFRLNLPNHMGNCDLCFLKARWKRAEAARADPVGAQWWADWEARLEARGVTGDGARFIRRQSYAALIREANAPDLFDRTEQDIPCSCAVGGYRHADDDL